MDCHLANVPFSVFPGGPFPKNATQALWLAENANVRTRGIDAAELLESLPDPVTGCDTGGTIVYGVWLHWDRPRDIRLSQCRWRLPA
jgi:hypothetical protein